jgi:hypothetical protein
MNTEVYENAQSPLGFVADATLVALNRRAGSVCA